MFRSITRAFIFALLCAVLATTASAALNAPSGLNTTNLKATSFTLRWVASTGAIGGIAGYDIYKNGALIGTSTIRIFAVTNLAPVTTYSMSVIARDKSGNVSPSSAALPVITTSDTSKPAKPTGLTASGVTTTSFTLTWTVSADNVGVTGYNIYRANVLVGSSPTTIFNLTGLIPDTNNRMTVRAMDAAGNLSGASVVLVVRTLADPPSVPSGLSVTNLKAASFTLKWTASTGGTGGIAGYDIYRDGVLASSTTKRSYVFTGLTPVTSYSLTVASHDTMGNVSAPSAPLVVTTPADTTKPTVPTGLSASAVTHNSFTLMWKASTDNVGVTGYDVLKNGALIGSTSTTSFNVTGLAPLTVYSMRVKARDAAGNISAASVILSVTTSMVPNIPPAVTLTSPAAGTTFTAPATITLAATAKDSDGSIAKVEFFDGTTKLGETLTPTTPPASFTLPFTFAAIGSHLLTARATDNKNATTDSAPVNVRFLSGLPYITDFEATEDYTPGSLNDQHGWTVATGTAQVTTADAAHGEQSVVLDAGATAALVDQEFGAGTSNPPVVFFDLFAKPVAGADAASGTIFDLDNARLAFVLNGASGQFAALDGDGLGAGTWKNQDPLLPLSGSQTASAWQRLTVRLDYTAKLWDFYLNSQLLVANLKFRYNSSAYFGAISFQGHTATGAGLDDLYAGADNPLFTDADRDGMDDAWESAHGLNPTVNDRDGDLDGDGLTNIQEYILGTDPSKADTDGDGLTDAQELALGTNPDNADSDGDSIPDGWEQQHGLNPLSDADAALDSDGDGQSNLEEFQAGTDPGDYFNGQAPLLSIVSGNNQTGIAGQFNAQPFIVLVTNAAGTITLANAPVTFTVQSGGGQLALTNTGSPALSGTLNARTDAEGTVQVYYQQAGAPNVPGTVLASAASAQTTFTTTSTTSGPVDSDNNGLPDAWEQQYFGRIGITPNGDPDNDGFNNLQEFQNGTDPNSPNLNPTDADGDGLPDDWEMRYFGTLDYGPDDQFNGMTGTLLQYFQQGLVPRLQVPDVIPGLRAWYSVGSGIFFSDSPQYPPPIRLWADISGNGLHLAQTTVAAQPAYLFDEDYTQHMIFTGGQHLDGVAADVLAAATNLTVFALVKPAGAQAAGAMVAALGDGTAGGFTLHQSGANSNQYVLSWRRTADQSVQGGSITVDATADQLQLLTFVKNGVTQSGYLNGEVQSSGIVAADLQPISAQLSLGGQQVQGNAGFSGEINEILVYNRALSAVEQGQVEDALLHKYRLDDTDHNGLPDRWEKQHFGHLGVDRNGDADGDGLTNWQERQSGTNPTNGDTDGDGVTDGQENALGTDPNDPNSKAPAQITWLSRSTNATVIPDQQVGAPGLLGFTNFSTNHYQEFSWKRTQTGSPLGDGVYTMTATYNPDDPLQWAMVNNDFGYWIFAPVQTYDWANAWLGRRGNFLLWTAQYGGTFTDTTAQWTETHYYTEQYGTPQPYTEKFDVTLSKLGEPVIIPGHTEHSSGQWSIEPPTASHSGSSYSSSEYNLLVPTGTTGTLFWNEIFTPSIDPSQPTTTLRYWKIDGTKSPAFTLTAPADGSSEVMLLDLNAELAVDANRDGTIKLASEDASDATSADSPYRFWLNDDDDEMLIGLTETEEDDRDVTSLLGTIDWKSDFISSKRDLEDFSRLWINTQGLNDSFKPKSDGTADLYLGLKWTDVSSGAPAIKIFKHVEAEGGTGYLNDPAIAQEQINGAPQSIRDVSLQHSEHVIEGGTPYVLPPSLFSDLTEAKTKTYLLFEGCKVGAGQLKLVILDKNKQPIGEGPGVWLDLKEPKEFIQRWTCGDGDRTAVTDYTLDTSKSGSFAAPSTNEEKDLVLYVHGYNMQEFEKQRWLETTYKRLYWLGYKGRVGGFTWPCSQSTLPYDESELRAWQSGEQLRLFLDNSDANKPGLKQLGYRVHVIAHSQGNVVMGEALRQAGARSNLVSTYVASQAALPGHCYNPQAELFPFQSSMDDGTPNVYARYWKPGSPDRWPENWPEGNPSYLAPTYMSGAAGRYVNFYNDVDYALTGTGLTQGAWELSNKLKPDGTEYFSYSSTDGFRQRPGGGATVFNLKFPDDRFGIFAYGAEARSRALGARPTGGVFTTEINLRTAFNFTDEHIYHSGQFRSFYAARVAYWTRLLVEMGLRAPE